MIRFLKRLFLALLALVQFAYTTPTFAGEFSAPIAYADMHRAAPVDGAKDAQRGRPAGWSAHGDGSFQLAQLTTISVGAGGFGGGFVPAYVPTLGTAIYSVYGAKAMLSATQTNLYELECASGTTKHIVKNTGTGARPDLPDYAGDVNPFVNGTCAGTACADIIYDQSGNAHNMAVSFGGTGGSCARNQPYYDQTQTWNGVVPLIFQADMNVSTSTTATPMRNTMTFSTQNVSAFLVTDPVVSYQLNPLLGSSGNFSLYTDGAGVLNTGSGATFTSGQPAMPRAMPSVLGIVSNATNVTVYNRETTYTSSTVATPSSPTYWDIGYRFGGGGQRFFGAVFYNAALTSTDPVTLRTALISGFNIPTAFTSRDVFLGNSIMVGYKIPNLVNMPYQLSGLPGTPEIFNVGVTGQNLSAQVTAYSTQVAPLYTAAYGAKIVLIRESGVNDMVNGGITCLSAVTQASCNMANTGSGAANLYSSAHATGFYVLGTTILQDGYSGAPTAPQQTVQTYIDNFAQVVRISSSPVLQDAIVDTYANATMGGANKAAAIASTANATNYNTDQLHPTSVGDLILAPIYSTALAPHN